MQTNTRLVASRCLLAAAIIAAVSACNEFCWARAREKPNVLLICVDDLRNCLDLDGDPIAETPNLDRLAREGRYFRHHYVQVAACGPSRCSMLTGRRIIQTWDVWSADRSARKEPAGPVSFAHHFRRHGYATVSIGKVSHEPSGSLPPEDRAQSGS